MLSKLNAIKAMLLLSSLVVVFHLLIVAGVIPYQVVWAGRLNTTRDMYEFEAVSILVNLLLIRVLLLKKKHNNARKWVNWVLYLFIALFVLNTLGNLTAKTNFERWVFTPLTLLCVLLLFVIVAPRKA